MIPDGFQYFLHYFWNFQNFHKIWLLTPRIYHKHASTNIIRSAIESDEFEYVNLHWYFVNDLNWSCIESAAKRDMGVFIISPNDKGGKLYAPPAKLVDLCKPLSPMQFNSLYCLNRSQVHTLSCGAAKPSDFDDPTVANQKS